MTDLTNISYRYAVEPQQGVGFSENTGTDWIFPEAQTQHVTIYDSDGLPHTLVIDNNDGLMYDISGIVGATGGSLIRVVTDKVAVGAASTSGTAIAPVLWFPEDTGEDEHQFINNKESHIYARPYSESNRDATGYDSNGYLSGLTLDLDLYEDGNPSTAKATVTDIPKTGDICFDKSSVGAHRLQLRLSAEAGDHIITGRQFYYVAEDMADTPANRTMTEDDYQAEFKTPVLWVDIRDGGLINRVTGADVSGTFTAVADPIGHTRGIEIDAALTLPSATLGASGALLIWYDGTIAMTIGGAAQALTDHSATTVEGYTLAYASTVNKTGAVVITPTGAASIFCLICINSTISAGARGYHFTDVQLNSGGNVIPRR